MTAVLIAAACALFAWWFGTGVVLLLDGLPRRTYRASMLIALLLAMAAMLGLAHSSTDATSTGALVAFACALVIWGALEMSYLLGFVTGWHSEPCPQPCSETQRFWLAFSAIGYHELAALAVAGAVAVLCFDAPNQVGLWTYLVLWLMRLSAKLNLFFGVPNFHQEWLPDHLRYLVSYLRVRPMNVLFPVSVTAASALATWLIVSAFSPLAGELERTGFALVGSLLAIAALEHWLLMLPVADSALWRWALRADAAERRVPPPLTETRQPRAHP